MGSFTRREALRALAASTAGLCVWACGEDAARTSLKVEGGRALIIGSGFGGAVAALRLGQAGITTDVLERGRRWPITEAADTFSPTLTPDGRSAWMREESIAPIGPSVAIDRYPGVLERIDMDGMQVYTGAAVGGGSVVYGGMTVQPPRHLFEREMGDLVSYDEMEAVYFPRVREMLSVSTVPDDIMGADFYQVTRVALAQAAAAGVETTLIDQATDWDVVRAEWRGDIAPCATVGDLLYGGNSGYKNSLDGNYLPMAEATGHVTIHPSHQVERIRRVDGRYVVDVSILDAAGEPTSSVVFEADYLFMAAGSVNTTRLLVEAAGRGDLPDLDPTLGTGWGANGNTMFMRSGLDTPTGRIQANPPIMAHLDFDNPHVPMVVEQAPFPIGVDCQCIMHLAVAMDDRRGQFVFDGDAARLSWPGDGHSDLVRLGVEAHVKQLSDVSGGTLGHPWLPEPTTGFTYHPAGGVNMGQAADGFGRVKGYDRLYVVDGALLPGTSMAANPSLLIAALAERALDAILTTDLA